MVITHFSSTNMLIRIRQHWPLLRSLLASGIADGAAKEEDAAIQGGKAATSEKAKEEQNPDAHELDSCRFDFLPWIAPGREPDSSCVLWHALDPTGVVLSPQALLECIGSNSLGGAGSRGVRHLPRWAQGVGPLPESG